MRIILASTSPRRQELLRQMGITDFIVIPPKGEEKLSQQGTPYQAVEALSRQKAEEIASTHPDDVVIGADTVVALNRTIFGKPDNAEDAIATLTILSGRTHTVYTGVTVCYQGISQTTYEQTQVRFRTLTHQEICAYVATGEPLDKSGSYGIQGMGALLIADISGDYCNVVGLPISCLGQMLRQFGIDLLSP